MSEKLHRPGDDLDLGYNHPAPPSASPGKSTLTAKLFRRAVRDDHGVVAGAGDQIDRAAGSSGSSLPDDLRERFESSLGADLSGVRVHTGAESQSAASAVGAKAYAVGNDIHFGAGQYNPSSSEGMFLIAHEVAHTVQQAGSTPMRQDKLEVSVSADPLEADADRAAAAMVRGGHATVTSAGAGGGLVAYRTPNYDEINNAGDDGAQNKGYDLEQARGHGYGTGDTMPSMGSSNIEDRSQAIGMLNLVLSQNDAIAASTKTDRLAHNNTAATALRDYIRASADQNFAQSLFEPELEKVKIQFTRLETMFQTHFAQHCDTPSEKGTGVDLANEVVTAGTKTTAENASDVKRQLQQQGSSPDVTTNNEMQTIKADIQAMQVQLQSYGGALSGTSAAVITANKELRGAVNAQGNPPELAETDDEKAAKTAVEGVKADLESAVQTVNTIGSIAKQGAAFVPGGTEATQMVESVKTNFENGMKLADAATRQPGAPVAKVDLTTDVVKYFTNFDAKLAAANGRLAKVKADKYRQWARAAIDNVKTKGEALKSAYSAHQRVQDSLQALQVTLRAQTDKLVKLMPKAAPGQPDLGVALSLQNEAAVFTATADGAIAVAKRERDEAKRAKDAKATAADGSEYEKNPGKYFHEMVAEKAGLKFWLCRRIQGAEEGYGAYQFNERQIAFTKTPKNEMNTQEALDSNMDRCIQRIEGMKTKADTFAKRMAELTGIGRGRY